MKKFLDYNIGLDIGTTSVGYAVTNSNCDLFKIKGKNMWGVRLFEEADKAVNTRTLRGARRRYDRRKQRIKLLQSFFLESGELDTNFFEKMANTYVADDSKKYNLFDEPMFNDKHYFGGEEKTIYHWRKRLITTTEKEDIRIVYLALHHIVKYRGNFLYEDMKNLSAQNANIETSMAKLVDELAEKYGTNNNDETIKSVCDIINDQSMLKKEKKKELANTLSSNTETRKIIAEVFSAVFNYAFNIRLIFENCDFKKIDEKKKIKLGKEEDLELLPEFEENDAVLFDAIMDAFNSLLLQKILYFGSEANDEPHTLSDAMIYRYNKYHSDLTLLKKLYKKYLNESYKDMFVNEIKDTKNYVAYINVCLVFIVRRNIIKLICICSKCFYINI